MKDQTNEDEVLPYEAESTFLTGGTGFIGHHLRDILAKNDLDVTLLVRPETSVSLRENESLMRGDIADQRSFSLAGHNTIIHLAAQTSVDAAITSPRSTWEVNANGTLNILEKARKQNIDRFLLLSTASVYGRPCELPITENHPLNPVEPYGASKLAGDRLTMSYYHTYGIPIVIARLFNTFGPNQPNYNVVPLIIEQALNDEVVKLGNLSPSRDFLFVKDAVEAVFTLYSKGKPGEVYNIGYGESIQIGNLAQKITQLINEDIPITSSKDRQRNQGAEIKHHVSDSSKLRALDWSPQYTIEQGLLETIERFRSQ